MIAARPELIPYTSRRYLKKMAVFTKNTRVGQRRWCQGPSPFGDTYLWRDLTLRTSRTGAYSAKQYSDTSIGKDRRA